MALTREFLGIPSTNEKYLLKATTDNVNVTTVILTISVDGVNVFSIEHLPDIGTSDKFSFNISEIIKEYYDTAFFDLSINELTTKSFNTKRIIAVTEEVIGLVPVGVSYNDNIFSPRKLTETTHSLNNSLENNDWLRAFSGYDS